MSETTEYVEVFATVTPPYGEPTRVYVGSYPADCLPVSPEWKKARRALAFDCVGHYPTRGDSWRVSFKVGA